ncbi:MAG TPA: carboxypeptidase-like regulatory domain-containing protein, partial [Longimicrobiales bacterium]
PNGAYKDGVILIPNVPGYRAASATTLKAQPAGGVVDLALEPIPTRVFGTVVDAAKNPLSNVVVVFQGGLATDTTDQSGSFSVTLPLPPGTRLPIRALKNGRTGYSDMITIPDNASLTIFFTPQP